MLGYLFSLVCLLFCTLKWALKICLSSSRDLSGSLVVLDINQIDKSK